MTPPGAGKNGITPDLRTPERPPHNLPAPRSSFVGREREMLEVKRELTVTRLLTLTGAGGSGKTRLALEAARDLVEAYPDGVWLVELAPISEGELVAQAVAAALGVLERPGEPLVATLVEAIGPKKLLLILDNCEHLVEEAARLADELLDACPRLRILATSREALDVPGELRWPVPLLSGPDPRRIPTVEELERAESARLFVERAGRRDPAFSLSAQNAGAVAEVCRRLEGIPLAIELAAAWVGTLSLTQLAFASSRNMGGDGEIFTMASDGTDQGPLTENQADDDLPVWSPDGAQLAFSSDRDGNYEIYTMNSNGTNQTNITNNAASDTDPDWQPL